MIMISTFAVLMLAPSSGASACADNLCRARAFAAKAPVTAEKAQRAAYYEAAALSYIGHYDDTKDPGHLCDARRMYQQAVATLSTSEAAHKLKIARERLTERERSARPACGQKRARAASANRAVANRRSAAPARATGAEPTAPSPAVPARTTEVEPAPARTTEAVPTTPGVVAARAETPLLPVSTAAKRTTPPPNSVDASMKPMVAVSPLVAGPPSPATRVAPVPGRRLVIAGGVSLGVGVGLLGVAGYAGGRVAGASRELFQLFSEVEADGDSSALAQEAALRRDFDRWLPVTIGTAVAGTAAVVVGAVLLRAGKRQMKPLRAALLPSPGGVTIVGRF
jgi:hypothetical protein